MPRRLSPSQIAGVIQFVVALALAIALLVLMWRFFEIADRLPGGGGRYVYLPIAMAAAIGLALWRAFVAFRLLRRSRDDGGESSGVH